MTSRRAGIALLLAIALLAGVPRARADTWPPPAVEVIHSAHWSARATITPNQDYGPRGDPSARAHARVERHVRDGQWRVAWAGPLLNSTAPVDALVSDDGATLVTFDNHHFMGHGDDVVVIYDAGGRVVRKRSLEQLLPAAWIEASRRSVSSIWWRGDRSAIIDGGRTLLIDVIAPGEMEDLYSETTQPPRTVPLLLRLADGAALHAQRPQWQAALRELGPIVARKDQAWERHRATQAAVLFAPAGRDRRAWRDFMELVRERLAHQTGERVFGMYLRDDVAPDECCDAAVLVAEWFQRRAESDPIHATHSVFVSPDRHRLLALLEKQLAITKPGTLAGVTLWIPASAAEFERLREVGALSGIKLERIDLEAGMAGIDLPKPRPYLFTGEKF